MNRAEHLAWAKGRALQELEAGSTTTALASIQSDLRKHPELADHTGLGLMMALAMGGHLTTHSEVREFIEGLR